MRLDDVVQGDPQIFPTLVFGGGVIPESDIPFLKENGIKAVFTPGTTSEQIVTFLTDNIKK